MSGKACMTSLVSIGPITRSQQGPTHQLPAVLLPVRQLLRLCAGRHGRQRPAGREVQGQPECRNEGAKRNDRCLEAMRRLYRSSPHGLAVLGQHADIGRCR